MRGQPLLFLGTVVLLWTVARVLHHLPSGNMGAEPLQSAQAPILSRADPSIQSHRYPVAAALAMLGVPAMWGPPIVSERRHRPQPLSGVAGPGVIDVDFALVHRRSRLDRLIAPAQPADRETSPGIDGPQLIDPVPSVPPWTGDGTGPAPMAGDKKWSVYGWSLLRQGTRARALAPAAQYGGSQAGLILRYRLGDGVRGPFAYSRVATALASDDDRTLAVGLSARPWRALPLDLAVERRFDLSTGQPDRFAAMLVAGGGTTLGRSQVQLEGFGQAGIVGLADGRGFFDVQMLATRQIAAQGDTALSFGGGVWAGGQQEIDTDGGKRWLHRVDMGPRATLALPVGNGRVTVAIDWRQRVDGNAQPGSGAAITVSTGF